MKKIVVPVWYRSNLPVPVPAQIPPEFRSGPSWVGQRSTTENYSRVEGDMSENSSVAVAQRESSRVEQAL